MEDLNLFTLHCTLVKNAYHSAVTVIGSEKRKNHFVLLLCFYSIMANVPKDGLKADIKLKNSVRIRYYIFYYTVNIADFQEIQLVAFLQF